MITSRVVTIGGKCIYLKSIGTFSGIGRTVKSNCTKIIDS